MKDLEAQQRADAAAIEALVESGHTPIELPTPEEILRRRVDLEQIVATDPTRAREELRRLFEGGQLLLRPQADGTYTAESRLFPLLAFTGPDMKKAGPGGGSSPRAPALGCAGAL